MDQGEFESASNQRVYQYIQRYDAGQNLDHFSYNGVAEGTPQDCTKTLLRYGMKKYAFLSFACYVAIVTVV